MQIIHAPPIPRNVCDLSLQDRALLTELATELGETPEKLLETMLFAREVQKTVGADPREAMRRIAVLKRDAQIVRRPRARVAAWRAAPRLRVRPRAARRARTRRAATTTATAKTGDSGPSEPPSSDLHGPGAVGGCQ